MVSVGGVEGRGFEFRCRSGTRSPAALSFRHSKRQHDLGTCSGAIVDRGAD